MLKHSILQHFRVIHAEMEIIHFIIFTSRSVSIMASSHPKSSRFFAYAFHLFSVRSLNDNKHPPSKFSTLNHLPDCLNLPQIYASYKWIQFLFFSKVESKTTDVKLTFLTWWYSWFIVSKPTVISSKFGKLATETVL